MHKTIQISILILTLFLFGCQSGNNTTSPPSGNQNQNLIHVKNSNPDEQEQLRNEDIATHLSNVAGQIQGVNDAASVVIGPYAVVGIDIDENLDRQRVGSIKYTVAETLRSDPYGKTAVVVADADMMERFRGMGDEIQNGRPVKGVIEELAEIVNRYIPDIPVDENKNLEQDQPNDLPPESEDELKEIQEEQSNDKNAQG